MPLPSYCVRKLDTFALQVQGLAPGARGAGMRTRKQEKRPFIVNEYLGLSSGRQQNRLTRASSTVAIQDSPCSTSSNIYRRAQVQPTMNSEHGSQFAMQAPARPIPASFGTVRVGTVLLRIANGHHPYKHSHLTNQGRCFRSMECCGAHALDSWVIWRHSFTFYPHGRWTYCSCQCAHLTRAARIAPEFCTREAERTISSQLCKNWVGTRTNGEQLACMQHRFNLSLIISVDVWPLAHTQRLLHSCIAHICSYPCEHVVYCVHCTVTSTTTVVDA